MKKEKVTFTVNGDEHELLVEPNALLLSVLRDMGLTGAKYACGVGQCGGCTVLMNGEAVLSCLVLAVAANGAEIQTVEGLVQPDGTLDPLQDAFLDHGAIQCGFCTPGMVMISKDLFNHNPSPSEKEIREHIRGNICRCTGYNSIVRAVKSCTK